MKKFYKVMISKLDEYDRSSLEKELKIKKGRINEDLIFEYVQEFMNSRKKFNSNLTVLESLLVCFLDPKTTKNSKQIFRHCMISNIMNRLNGLKIEMMINQITKFTSNQASELFTRM